MPTDIAGLTLWLTAEEEFLFTDAAATIPVTADGDVVGAWEDRSGNNNDFSQANAAKKPEFKTAQLGGKDVVRFDGIDNLLTAANFSSATEGSLFITYQLTAALIDFQTLFSTSDEAGNVKFFLFRPYRQGIEPNIQILQDDDDVFDSVLGDTVILVATSYLVTYRSDGSAYTMRVNGSDETLNVVNGANNGDWFGDTSDRDNFAIGALKRLAEANFLKGDKRQTLLYDSNLTGSDLANAESFMAADAGIILP